MKYKIQLQDFQYKEKITAFNKWIIIIIWWIKIITMVCCICNSN